MTTFLAIQNTYYGVEIGLFNDQQCIEQRYIDKHCASKKLIPVLSDILAEQKKTISDLSFIAVNQGPSPFSTLRVVIASANGLAYASKIPLIGVDALMAMLSENYDPAYSYSAVLLNAFNQYTYAAIKAENSMKIIGCYHIQELLMHLSDILNKNEKVKIVGNGGLIFEPLIKTILSDRAYIASPLPEYCTLNSIASLGLNYWHEGLRSYELMPQYLKKAL